MPKKLLAVSDIEGNIEHLIQFLQFHNIIDMQYNWSWGTNHLLFNGDSVIVVTKSLNSFGHEKTTTTSIKSWRNRTRRTWKSRSDDSC